MANHFDFEEAIIKSEESRCQLAMQILPRRSRGERRANNAEKYRRRSKIITQDKKYNLLPADLYNMELLYHTSSHFQE